MSAVVRVSGGRTAPGTARHAVLEHLAGQLDDRRADDVGLIVSELVTNAVRHAGVGPDGEILIRLLVIAGRLRLAVEDPGSDLVPRRSTPDPEQPGGMGLFIVEHLANSWGVARNGVGTTNVWCEVAL